MSGDPTIGNPFYDQYSGQGMAYAQQYGIPWPIFKGLISQESGWNPDPPGYNDGGSAHGFGQLHSGAASDAGVSVTYINDPASNLQGAAAYLKQQYQATGNWKDALAAYNDGAGNYGSSKGQTYASSVLNWAKGYGWDGSQVAATSIGSTPSGGIGSDAVASQTAATPAGNSLWDWFSGIALGGAPGTPGSDRPTNLAIGGAPATQRQADAIASQQAGLMSSIEGLIANIQKLFTADFWKNVSVTLVVGVVIVALIVFGIYATVAPHATAIMQSTPVNVAQMAGVL